jgi:hypothetical protein
MRWGVCNGWVVGRDGGGGFGNGWVNGGMIGKLDKYPLFHRVKWYNCTIPKTHKLKLSH